MRIPWLGIHIVREEPEPELGWAQEEYVRLFEAVEDGDGERYLGMMYAAFVRECRVPAMYVALCEYKGNDGSKMYRLVDAREFTT